MQRKYLDKVIREAEARLSEVVVQARFDLA